mgnify:CR=1 FL=1
MYFVTAVHLVVFHLNQFALLQFLSPFRASNGNMSVLAYKKNKDSRVDEILVIDVKTYNITCHRDDVRTGRVTAMTQVKDRLWVGSEEGVVSVLVPEVIYVAPSFFLSFCPCMSRCRQFVNLLICYSSLYREKTSYLYSIPVCSFLRVWCVSVRGRWHLGISMGSFLTPSAALSGLSRTVLAFPCGEVEIDPFYSIPL